MAHSNINVFISFTTITDHQHIYISFTTITDHQHIYISFTTITDHRSMYSYIFTTSPIIRADVYAIHSSPHHQMHLDIPIHQLVVRVMLLNNLITNM